MASTALVSIEEYLRTSYRPDRDYVDGVVLERNFGELRHSRVLGALLTWLHGWRKSLGIHVFVEMRIRVGATRYRIPDVCVYRGEEPAESVPSAPPYLCIEVLSPDDTIHAMQARIDDYFAMGVPQVWVIDPDTRRAWIHTPGSSCEVKDGVLRTAGADIAVRLEELFEG